MKKLYSLLLVALLMVGCNTDDKIALQLIEEKQYGAVVRTLNINNGEFIIGDPSSEFSVNIEEQDEAFGELFQSIDVYVRFVDNTDNGSNFSTAEVKMEELPSDQFTPGGSEGLPRTTMNYTYGELLQATGVAESNVSCKDQFLLRLDLNLTDGRSFTTGSASSIIIAYETFFSSPYCYTINVVEPIDEDLFVGTYNFQSLVDTPEGPSFRELGPVEIRRGNSDNERVVALKHRRSHPTNELPRNYYFTIACDELIFQKNMLSSVIGYCGFSGAPILLGPDTVNAPVNINDDSVFEVWFVEGYLGWDGECGFGTVPSRVRFTKQ